MNIKRIIGTTRILLYKNFGSCHLLAPEKTFRQGRHLPSRSTLAKPSGTKVFFYLIRPLVPTHILRKSV
ncbi:hypothetical protein ANAEL_00111 [Anaerolineales bacterium]|nr:hypothetical protein ANAEL_00111 [Anaerolineales bacterium]